MMNLLLNLAIYNQHSIIYTKKHSTLLLSFKKKCAKAKKQTFC